MSFVWVEDITKGVAEITKAATKEIRTNLDQIKDNEACVADKVSYNASQDTIVNSGYNSVHYNDEHSTYRDDHNSGVDTGDNSVYNSGEKGTYYNDVNQAEDSPHDSGVDDTYKSNVNNLDNDAQYAAFHTLNKTDHKVGVYYTQNAAEYTDVYHPHDAIVNDTYYSGNYNDDHYSY